MEGNEREEVGRSVSCAMQVLIARYSRPGEIWLRAVREKERMM